MNKTLKRVLIGVLVTVGVIGAAWGIMTGIRAANRSPVKVYSVENFMTTYWGDTAESYGSVRMSNIQKLYLSESQSVREIFVKEGDVVKKGDSLMAYDTTLTLYAEPVYAGALGGCALYGSVGYTERKYRFDY